MREGNIKNIFKSNYLILIPKMMTKEMSDTGNIYTSSGIMPVGGAI